MKRLVVTSLVASIFILQVVVAATPIDALKKVGVEVIPSPYVQTEQDDRIQPEDQNTVSDDINFWKERLQYQDDRNRTRYLVIPKLGVIAPINTIYENEPDFQRVKKGQSFELNKYLQTGILRYPMTALPGHPGNMVLFGHSSYFKSDRGRYKTIFTTIALLGQGDKIRVYVKKEGTDQYTKHEYNVFKSYATPAKDLSVMDVTQDATLTLVGCTPIGTADARYIIKAKLTSALYQGENPEGALILPTAIPDSTLPDQKPDVAKKDITTIVFAEGSQQEENVVDSAMLASIQDQDADGDNETKASEDDPSEAFIITTETKEEEEAPQAEEQAMIDDLFSDDVPTNEEIEAYNNMLHGAPTKDYASLVSEDNKARINKYLEQIAMLPPEAQQRITNRLDKYFYYVDAHLPQASDLAGYMRTLLQ